MTKLRHELRDGIHGFVLFDNLEKAVIDSAPMQRLRCIHQLAMCYQIYPGAEHKRFEHSLGVMEVATRIFDRLFERRLPDGVQDRLGSELEAENKAYWRHVVRLAGLLHDVGHLPFSHAAEEALLPAGWNHERLSVEIVRHSEVADILKHTRPQIDPEDIVDVIWDAKKRIKHEATGWSLSPWKTLLNEVICGNTFGADRIDYLLRDSWHAGVAYGRFDPDRLISGLTAVVHPETEEIAIALENGGIHTAEALLLARFFMYSQVYFHDVRRVYDLHLKEFLQAWLPGGKFPSDWQSHLKISDHEVLVGLREAASDPGHQLYTLASRVLNRKHFRTVYEMAAPHKQRNPSVLSDLLDLAKKHFGDDKVRSDQYGPKSETNDFPVLMDDGTIESSLKVSGVVVNLPAIDIGFIFVDPSIQDAAKKEMLRLHRSMQGIEPELK